MATTIFKFPKLGNLRRLADRREAAKHGHTRRRILEALRRLDPDHRRLDAILRDMKAMEADGVFDFPKPPLPITDISDYGGTYCTLHRITTVGNFCSACEAEAAGARVPVSKAAASIPEKDTTNPGEGFLYCEKHGTVIKDACMQFCPQCELEAMNDTNPDPDPGRLVTDGAEGGVS